MDFSSHVIGKNIGMLRRDSGKAQAQAVAQVSPRVALAERSLHHPRTRHGVCGGDRSYDCIAAPDASGRPGRDNVVPSRWCDEPRSGWPLELPEQHVMQIPVPMQMQMQHPDIHMPSAGAAATHIGSTVAFPPHPVVAPAVRPPAVSPLPPPAVGQQRVVRSAVPVMHHHHHHHHQRSLSPGSPSNVSGQEACHLRTMIRQLEADIQVLEQPPVAAPAPLPPHPTRHPPRSPQHHRHHQHHHHRHPHPHRHHHHARASPSQSPPRRVVPPGPAAVPQPPPAAAVHCIEVVSEPALSAPPSPPQKAVPAPAPAAPTPPAAPPRRVELREIARHHAVPQGPPEVVAAPPPPPQALAVVSQRQPSASGTFRLTRRVFNGHPVWACGERRLYSTQGGCWMIGGASHMQTESGRMASDPHSGAPPHTPGTRWAIHRQGVGWVPDPDSYAAENPALPAALRLTGVPQAEGTYTLMEGEVWRGHPVWADDDRRIYTVEKGCWIAGPATSMGMDAGWVMSALEHGGVPPDGVASWVVLDGMGGWAQHPGVRVWAVAEEVAEGAGGGGDATARHRSAVRRIFAEFADPASGLLDLAGQIPALVARLQHLHSGYAGVTQQDVDAALSQLGPAHQQPPSRVDLQVFGRFLYLMAPSLTLAKEPPVLDAPRDSLRRQ